MDVVVFRYGQQLPNVLVEHILEFFGVFASGGRDGGLWVRHDEGVIDECEEGGAEVQVGEKASEGLESGVDELESVFEGL